MRISTMVVIDSETGERLFERGYDYSGPVDRLDRGVQKAAKNQSQQNESNAGQSNANASIERSALIPGLISEANNPTGFTPQQKNNMLVSSQESVGGGNAALTGEGNLAALRTRTAGGFAPALDEAARAKGRQLSQNALGVENADARLAQQKQQFAQQQLQGLYGVDTSNALKAMGLSDQDLQTQLNAGNQGWLQNSEGLLGTIGKMGGKPFTG